MLNSRLYAVSLMMALVGCAASEVLIPGTNSSGLRTNADGDRILYPYGVTIGDDSSGGATSTGTGGTNPGSDGGDVPGGGGTIIPDAEIPESGLYSLKVNWYCAAVWMDLALVAPAQKSLFGHFGGDCTVPGYPRPSLKKLDPPEVVAQAWGDQELGRFTAGQTLRFSLRIDRGPRTSYSDNPLICVVEKIEGAAKLQFSCQDGLNIHAGWEDSGLCPNTEDPNRPCLPLDSYDDIQFTVSKVGE